MPRSLAGGSGSASASGWLAVGPDFENCWKRLARSAEGIYTLDTLKYLIHGGRISHLKGLLASVLQIRPIIGVDKESGKYYTLGQERTMKNALEKIADIVAGFTLKATPLRVQLLHGKNPEASGNPARKNEQPV